MVFFDNSEAVVRTGVDMVDVARFERIADPCHDRLIKKLFRPDEIPNLGSQRAMAMAFALKEAVSKALGTGIAQGVSWQDIRVVQVPEGGHRVVLYGTAAELAGTGRFHVSADSTESLAVAFVILESGCASGEDLQ
jgi:holo-[acyl-carrier protein] synthase